MKSKTISFRLPHEEEEILLSKAKRFEVSRHNLAKLYALEMLGHDEERAALREAVTALHAEIQALRKDITLSVEALLSSAGKVNEEKAKEWAKENLLG